MLNFAKFFISTKKSSLAKATVWVGKFQRAKVPNARYLTAEVCSAGRRQLVSRNCFRRHEDPRHRPLRSGFVPACSSHQTTGPKPQRRPGELPLGAPLHLSTVLGGFGRLRPPRPMLLLRYCSQWSQTSPQSSPVPPSRCTAPSRRSRSLPCAGPIPAWSRPTERLTPLHRQPVAAPLCPASCSKAEILHVELQEKRTNKQQQFKMVALRRYYWPAGPHLSSLQRHQRTWAREWRYESSVQKSGPGAGGLLRFNAICLWLPELNDDNGYFQIGCLAPQICTDPNSRPRRQTWSKIWSHRPLTSCFLPSLLPNLWLMMRTSLSAGKYKCAAVLWSLFGENQIWLDFHFLTPVGFPAIILGRCFSLFWLDTGYCLIFWIEINT